MTRVTRIMTPGTLIFASALIIGTLTIARYFRPEAIGVVPDGFAIVSTLKKFRARGFNTTSPILFYGDIRFNPCYTSLEKIST